MPLLLPQLFPAGKLPLAEILVNIRKDGLVLYGEIKTPAVLRLWGPGQVREDLVVGGSVGVSGSAAVVGRVDGGVLGRGVEAFDGVDLRVDDGGGGGAQGEGLGMQLRHVHRESPLSFGVMCFAPSSVERSLRWCTVKLPNSRQLVNTKLSSVVDNLAM